jgi:hypothetical protein
MLNGIGAGVGAMDSVRCTAPFRLAGLGFEALNPGCIAARRLSASVRTKVHPGPANAEGLSGIEEPCNQLIGWQHFEFRAGMSEDRVYVSAGCCFCLLPPSADV